MLLYESLVFRDCGYSRWRISISSNCGWRCLLSLLSLVRRWDVLGEGWRAEEGVEDEDEDDDDNVALVLECDEWVNDFDDGGGEGVGDERCCENESEGTFVIVLHVSHLMVTDEER